MTAPAKRVLMIEQGGHGGVSDYTTELIRELTAQGWSVTLATAEDHGYPAIDGVVVRGVFHYTRGRTPLGRALRAWGLGKPVNGLRFLATLPRLMRLAARVDIVHSQGWEIPQIGPPAVACLRLTGTQVVQTEHGAFDRTSTPRRASRLARRLTARLTARTIVHTQADLGRIGPLLGKRALVIPHGEYGRLARSASAAERDSARAALGLAPDIHATLMFGQLRIDKGLDDLVAAVTRVTAVHLLIGGQDLGGLAAVRERLAALGDRVSVHEGFRERRETAELFAAADTVALPYKQASQSGVLLLAYGFSRPVIVYPSGGMAEAVIDGDTGWICVAPTVDALADALAASVQAGPRECARRGERGRQLAQDRYAWPAIARRTAQVYEEVLACR